MTSKTVSIIIIAGNEQQIIGDCLKSVSWANQIILVAANSTDNTKKIAKTIIPKIGIIKTTDQYNKNFSKWRNLGFKAATKDWHFYVDADERVSRQLKQEIRKIINSKNPKSYYVIPRANYFLGKRVKHGGSYPDYVKRLFQANKYQGWRGQLHEQPIVYSDFGYLKTDILHFTHRDLSSMLQKTIAWTELEAQALFKSHHPPVVWWRFPRMMATTFWQRMIQQSFWRDGIVGWISVIFEMFNTFIIYARLWEKQQNET